jgi:long-chain fatty acid transport protein
MYSGWLPSRAAAQTFGIETHNTVMPAAGGMGGVGIARPQDLLSSLTANPATLTQFLGTNVTFGGAWAEPTYLLSHAGGVLPRVGAFSAKSEAEGSAPGNIGIAQDFHALGMPAVAAFGLTTAAGAGISFNDVAASNGTSVYLSVLEINSAMAVELTDRLSAGTTLSLGSSTIDAPFIAISSATYAYQLRGALGLTYELPYRTTIGLYYQTRQNFNFDDAIRLELFNGQFSRTFDVNLGLPDNYGIGIANQSLMDGRLLLAADVLYKQWDTADLLNVVYENQWVFQLGSQYQLGPHVRLRAGYAYADNPLDPSPSGRPGGLQPPGAQEALYYMQGLLAISNRHRISGGVGIQDLLPGIDLDLLAGGMFEDDQQLGQFTSTSVASYWAGAGLTWRFGRGGCQRLPPPNQW